MHDPDRLEAKGLARAKVRAKRRRARSIRRRTVRSSLALFAVVWTIVFVQLVSGNDPALSRIPQKHSRAAAAAKPQPAREPAVPIEEVPIEVEPEVEATPESPPEPIVTSSS